MIKFLLKTILLLILPLYCTAALLQPFLDAKLKESRISGLSENFKEWNDIYESRINADLIIQGSSKAWVQIDPRVLDSVFKLNTYNLGIDGYPFNMQYYRFQAYLKHNRKPDYIIQVIDNSVLSRRSDLYMPHQFLPYFGDKTIREAVGAEPWDMLVPCYKYIRYNSCFLNALWNKPLSWTKYKGFKSQERKWDSGFALFQKANPGGYRINIDATTRGLFDNFVQYCKANNVKLIFVWPPEYIEAKNMLLNRDSIVAVLRGYSHQYGIPYLDFSSDSICYDKNNFYNSQHMNASGVSKFNAKLADSLKQLVPGKCAHLPPEMANRKRSRFVQTN